MASIHDYNAAKKELKSKGVDFKWTCTKSELHSLCRKHGVRTPEQRSSGGSSMGSSSSKGGGIVSRPSWRPSWKRRGK